jgi:glycosyltransferase involved in cell wall biosynthesis
VLLLGPYPPPHGGVETNVVALRDYLTERGSHCEVINLSGAGKASGPGVHAPAGASGVLQLLLRLRYDVVHFHVGGNLSPREAVLGLLCASLPRTRSVFTFHSGGYPSSEEGRRTRRRSLRALALRRFDAVIAVNDEIAAFFRRLGVDSKRIRVISPFGMSRRQVEEILAEDLETSLGKRLFDFFRAHDPVLVTIGGLEPEYDVPTQIDALEAVRKRHPRAGLVVVGDGGLRNEIDDRVACTSYADHIAICGDVKHRTAMRLLAESHLLLRTTLYDGDAISIREALQFGTPVIATDNAMRPAGVHLVPMSDPAALASKVIEALAAGRRPDPAEADQRGLEEVRKLYAELIG